MAVGYHVGKLKPGASMAESIVSSVTHAREMGVDVGCVQIFVMGPQSSHISISDDDAKKIHELTSAGLRVYVHSAYITANIYKPGGYGNVLCKQQLDLCRAIGASGFVVHLPRDTPDVAAKGLRVANKYRGDVPVYMEIEVAKPPKITYETPSKLKELAAKLAEVDDDFGICIDTAHLWSCGEGLVSVDDTKQWLKEYESLGIPRTLIHLNDSTKELGSGQDSHMALTKGNIWGEYEGDFTNSGAHYMLKWAKDKGVDVILERDEEGLVSDLGLIRRSGLYAQN